MGCHGRKWGVGPGSSPLTLLGHPTILYGSVWITSFPHPVPDILGKGHCHAQALGQGWESNSKPPFHTFNPPALGTTSRGSCSSFDLSHGEAMRLTFPHQDQVHSKANQGQGQSYSSPSFLRRKRVALLRRPPPHLRRMGDLEEVEPLSREKHDP